MAVGMGRILGKFFTGSGALQRFLPDGMILDQYGVIAGLQTPTFGSTVNIDLSVGTIVTIVATSNIAFTIANPTNARTGLIWLLAIRNSSGGAMGAITFGGAFKLPAFTNPANGFQRSLLFYFDGTNHRELIRGTDEPV